jgi:arginase
MMRTVFISVPFWMGDFSPPHAATARHTWRLVTPSLPDGGATERMGDLCRAVADTVASVRAEERLPVVMAGDCTVSIGVLAGLQRELPDLMLVWYDAHGDFNTPETTPSGFIGGMPLAMLCGRGEQTIVAAAGASVLPEAEVILTDARDLDPGEAEAVAASAVNHLADVADLTTSSLPDKPIYIHFDCDVLKTSDLPAVSYPAEGGPSLDTIEASLNRLADTKRIAAISVSMWNPAMDRERQAELVVMGLIERLIERL